MTRISRAFALASGERYVSLVINLASTAVLSRLLTPSEFGIVVIGISAAALAGAIAELGAASYIVQAERLNPDVLRSIFTINAGCTLALAAMLYLSAWMLAAFYRLPELTPFLHVFAAAFAIGAAWAPASALLARDLAFGRKSAISGAVNLINGAVTILLALHGFSYMSFAWAYLASNSIAALLYPLAIGDRSMFGVSFRDWRKVLLFGAFGGMARLCSVVGDNLAYLIIGRFVSPGAIGLLYRAGMVLTFPDRVLLGGASAVAFPAFSEAARTDKSRVGAVYLRTVELLSGIHWPAVITIGLLAHPLTALFLGRQWAQAATYVQIMCGAALFNAPISLNNPVQVSMGAIRATPVLALFQVTVTLVCVLAAAPHGPTMVAWSVWASTPINVVASVWLVRKVAPFPLRALIAVAFRSGGVAAATALGPIAIIMLNRGPDLGLAAGGLGLLLAAAGWVGGLALLKHPLLVEGLAFAGRALGRRRPA